MAKALKNRAAKVRYTSPLQLSLGEFDTGFGFKLNATNRWVILAKRIPWDDICSIYNRRLNNHMLGADGINPRVAIGALVIKHMCNLSDRETIQQIQENLYMQYFVGLPGFTDEPLFDPSVFVDIRKRLGIEQINEINERIMKIDRRLDTDENDKSMDEPGKGDGEGNKGKIIMDATACPQDIAYPTDLHLLNEAREKSEDLIDFLCEQKLRNNMPAARPRTYRKKARKDFLKTAQKKHKTKSELRRAIRKQLGYLRRNIKNIHKELDMQGLVFSPRNYKYWLVIQTLYEQQLQMFTTKTHSVAHRIVSIHQPHVRPIVRGKSNAYVEFGAKIQVSLMNGIAFLDELSWEAFNEGTRLKKAVEDYRARFGFYPEEVLADKIYCNRENRAWLAQQGIRLKAKPLGRPSKAVKHHVSPGERNPIEGLFGQAKNAYGLGKIRARLDITSESWIATTIMVLNLINIIGRASLCLVVLLNKWINRNILPKYRAKPAYAFA